MVKTTLKSNSTGVHHFLPNRPFKRNPNPISLGRFTTNSTWGGEGRGGEGRGGEGRGEEGRGEEGKGGEGRGGEGRGGERRGGERRGGERTGGERRGGEGGRNLPSSVTLLSLTQIKANLLC